MPPSAALSRAVLPRAARPSAALLLGTLAGCGDAGLPDTPDGPPTVPDAGPHHDAPPGAFVRARGTQLLLGDQPYRFKGLDIYNANSTGNCWYALGTAPRLDQSLGRIGPAQNALRAWFFQDLATTAGARDFSTFDRTLAVAAAHGLRVIATLANQWGDCEGAAAARYRTESFYQSAYRTTDPGQLRSYRDWVAEVVARYAADPTILMWQLLNEPEDAQSQAGPCSATATATLRAFAADMAGLVKSLDPNHLLSLGALGSGQCGMAGDGYQQVHAVPGIDVCEYHDYGQPNAPIPGDMWNGLAVRIGQCQALGKPLIVGETGIVASDVGSLQARAAAFDAKLAAQFNRGIAGELIWDFCDPAWNDSSARCNDTTSFDVLPGDPVLQVLAKY